MSQGNTSSGDEKNGCEEAEDSSSSSSSEEEYETDDDDENDLTNDAVAESLAEDDESLFRPKSRPGDGSRKVHTQDHNGNVETHGHSESKTKLGSLCTVGHSNKLYPSMASPPHNVLRLPGGDIGGKNGSEVQSTVVRRSELGYQCKVGVIIYISISVCAHLKKNKIIG